MDTKMTILGVKKIQAKGQLVIPQEARELLRVEPGDHVVFLHVDGKVVIENRLNISDIVVKSNGDS